MNRDVIVATNAQKVLDIFLRHPYTEYIEGDIKKFSRISRSGTNYALRELVKSRYIRRILKGKTYFYTVERKNPVVKQLKVLRTVRFLLPLIARLREISSTIILYGSAARGEDHEDSDIDLFTVSHSKEEIARRIGKFKSKRKIQCAVKTTLNYEDMKKTDPHYYNEINSGIVLWEKSHE